MARLTSKIAILVCLGLVCEARESGPSQRPKESAQVSRVSSSESYAQVDSVIPETTALIEKKKKCTYDKVTKKYSDCKTCNQFNKQKTLYTDFVHHPPLAKQPALDVVGDVTWGDLNPLRQRRKNGVFNAWSIQFTPKREGNGGSGYLGPQVSNGKNGKIERVLFSLWDHKPLGGKPGDAGWAPALPLTGCKYSDKELKKHPGESCCKRNGNDGKKAGLSDGSDGTQCKVFLPIKVESGTQLRSRIRRVGVGVAKSAYGQAWKGDAWEVTVKDVVSGKEWLVGRQLVAGTPADGSGGIGSISLFYEFIGCTTCGAYDSSSTVNGPWVLEPKGVQLMSASSKYGYKKEDGFTCRQINIASKKAGSFTVKGGPHATPMPTTDGTWRADLYRCPHDTGCQPPWVKAPAPAPPKCVDRPERWYDSYGDNCQTHKDKQWCTITGGYGPKWRKSWGKFSDYRNKDRWPNIDASQACCACGGGYKPSA